MTAVKWYQSLKYEVDRARREHQQHKARGYADNPGEVRVIVATRNATNTKSGSETNGAWTPTLGLSGKPADFTFARSEFTKQENGTWLLTSAQVLSGGPSCTVDAPLNPCRRLPAACSPVG